MSFLVTADLQAEWSNLDLCTESWDEMLHICKKYDIKTIVFAGDGKEAYDPLSVRIIQWWDYAIRKAIKLELNVFYLLGNHDRISSYSIAGNWLSILRRAGAITFDKPGVMKVEDRRFFFLPYAPVKETREWAKELVSQHPDNRKDILFAHCNLLEARYSQHGRQSDSRLSCKDLYHDKYLYVISGDIHMPQRLENNVYYVGSPFPHSWGEVNVRHRYLVVIDD